MKKILIIGIHSYIGTNLRKFLIKKNFEVFGTTHKKSKINKKNIYLNLKNPKNNFITKDFDAVVFCASVTSLKMCENKPEITKKINVTNTIKLMEYLNSKLIFTLFISSNLVFDGNRPFYRVLDKPNPICNYGKYKYLVEKYIKKKKFNNFSVLRSTKVIGQKSKFIKKIKEKIKNKKPIYYDKDYFLSPVQINEICKVIFKILKKKKKGLYQISGKKEYLLNSFLNSHLKRKILVKERIKKTFKWQNKHNSLKTFLPF